jgi:hypothetical protein
VWFICEINILYIKILQLGRVKNLASSVWVSFIGH